MKKPLIIGLTGLAGTGKDTVRGILEHYEGYTGLAFADPLRDMIGQLLDACGESRAWMVNRELKEQPIPALGVSYRHLAQTLGTEWGRDMIGSDMWVRIASARIKAMSAHAAEFDDKPAPCFVISDVRLPNEAAWIQSQGGLVWRVKRWGVDPVRDHASETGVDSLYVDRTIENNGTHNQLVEVVSRIPELSGAEVAA
jgi:hypothetical protein